MKIFKKVPDLDVMGKQVPAIAISLVIIVAGLFFWFQKGIKYGVDFKGGTLVQAKFTAEPPLAEIRSTFNQELQTSVDVTTFGKAQDYEILLMLPQEINGIQGVELQSKVSEIFSGRFPTFETIRRVESVGPKVGSELKEKAFYATIISLIGILAYVAFRFKTNYAVGAVVALAHDVLVTLGIFIFLEKEFTLTILAALLTIIGYSLNDTIVIFDRVRENVSKMPKVDLIKVFNLSINQTMSRTILTSLTTFLVVLSLFLFGGEIIHDFSLAMMIGLIAGTYSTVFIASPVVILFNKIKK